jgi:FtsP/CotA-like multicopper oxidase with cupredoxin domain
MWQTVEQKSPMWRYMGVQMNKLQKYLVPVFWISVVFTFLTASAFASQTRKIPDAKNLPELRPTQVHHLKDGDMIEFKAGFVKEKIDGRWMTRLAYNRQIPGPTLIVPRGSKIKLKLVNKTGEPTALHSHGLRVDDKNDGVVGIGQAAIENEQSMIYDLKFPDAGIYWYHPHMSDEYGQEMGLQGNFLVTDDKMGPLPLVDREEILMVDDILIEDGGMPGFKDGGLSFALMGRYGNKYLINNKSNWRSNARVGDIVRYWLTNSANARPVKIKFDGAKMKLIGADHGLYQSDQLVDDVVLAPSERAVVDVLFSKVGSTKIVNVGPGKPALMGSVDVRRSKILKGEAQTSKSQAFEKLIIRDALAKEFSSVRAFLAGKPDVTMRLEATLSGAHAAHMVAVDASHGGVEWEDSMPDMNEMMSTEDVTWRVIDAASGKENMNINWIFKKDVPTKIRIINDGKNHPMQHPIHFHGQRFAVIARDGHEQENLAWKDTVLVKAGETVDVVLDNQNPGRWMGHCHISEHLGAGMMFGFEVR